MEKTDEGRSVTLCVIWKLTIHSHHCRDGRRYQGWQNRDRSQKSRVEGSYLSTVEEGDHSGTIRGYEQE